MKISHLEKKGGGRRIFWAKAAECTKAQRSEEVGNGWRAACVCGWNAGSGR